MNQLVVVNLTTRSTDWQPPVLTFGESLTLALRFTKDVDGNLVEPNLTFDSIAASIGLVDARPGGGTFSLQFGADPSTSSNTTAPIPHDCSPAQLIAAINALTTITGTYGTATAKKFSGSWLLQFGSGSVEVPFKVANNALWPVSFGRVLAQPIDSVWLHELRLVQGPVAFTSSSDIVLPPAPSISEVRAGGTTSGIPFNELQQLYIPPTFRGAYTLIKGTYQRTPLLSPDAGPSDIQTALAALGDGFNVTLPTSFHFLIEFTDTFGGQAQPLLGVEVDQSPAGDLTFTLPLDRAELASLLRGVSAATLPLQVDIVCREDGGDPFQVTALFVPVTVQRSLNFPELEETPVIDWLRFPSPTSYVPFGADNVLTTGQSYAVTVGNGSATTFAITHGLASDDVRVFVRHNLDPGAQLVEGTDYNVTINSTNAVTVTALSGAPAAAAWRVMVLSAQTIAQWADGLTVTIAQVTGLEARLEADETNIASLLSLLPANASLPSGVAPVDGITITLPPTSGILFAKDPATGLPITDPTKLPARGAYLLPAIDSATIIGALPTSPYPTPALNSLWTTSAATLIPGGGGIRSSNSTASGLVGSDGRMLYPVTQSGSKDSYFPTPFELVLFEMAINAMMFSSGTTLTLLFKLALQLLAANSEAQWVLAIEQAPLPPSNTSAEDVSGSLYDVNLANVAWGVATPLVRQPLYLGSALQTHGFGATITQNSGAFTANGLVYKRVLSANANVLQSADFALRARLLNFDTKNSAAGTARGWVSWALQTPDSGTLGATVA